MEAYDKIIVLNSLDQATLRKYLDIKKIIVCPPYTKINYWGIRNEVKTIVFIASEYPPNYDGLKFFLENCWVSIYEKYKFNFYVFGTICELVNESKLLGVHYMGFVGDLQSIYSRSDIIINPVRFGGGTKIKSLEALSNGRPLVTTTHATLGLEQAPAHTFLSANSADELILCISNLIEDVSLRRTLSRNALAYCEKHYSEDASITSLLRLF